MVVSMIVSCGSAAADGTRREATTAVDTYTHAAPEVVDVAASTYTQTHAPADVVTVDGAQAPDEAFTLNR